MKSDTPWFTDDNQPATDDVPDDLGELRSMTPPPIRAYEGDERLSYIDRLESILEQVAVIADEYKDEELRALALSWRDEFGVRQS